MPNHLPERANIGQLRKQAKELLQAFREGDSQAIELLQRPGGGVPRLHDVQRALARERGFASWRLLIEHVESSRADAERLVVERTWRGPGSQSPSPSSDLPVERTPTIALMMGDIGLIRAQLKRDPSWVHKKIGPKQAEPLLYVCFSECLQIPELRERLLESARQLLEAGADPNATWQEDETSHQLRCLDGATANRSSELSAMLLNAGAKPSCAG